MPEPEASFLEKKEVALPLLEQLKQWVELYRPELHDDLDSVRACTLILFGEEMIEASNQSKPTPYCKCWMSLNTGPNGECESCGLVPDFKRIERMCDD